MTFDSSHPLFVGMGPLLMMSHFVPSYFFGVMQMM